MRRSSKGREWQKDAESSNSRDASSAQVQSAAGLLHPLQPGSPHHDSMKQQQEQHRCPVASSRSSLSCCAAGCTSSSVKRVRLSPLGAAARGDISSAAVADISSAAAAGDCALHPLPGGSSSPVAAVAASVAPAADGSLLAAVDRAARVPASSSSSTSAAAAARDRTARGVAASPQKKRMPLLRRMCKLMFSAAVVEGARVQRKRKMEISPPSTDKLQLLQLVLPTHYLQLLRLTLLRNCPHCGLTPDVRALCLLCGSIVCLGSECCREEGVSRDAAWSECMLHAHACGGGSCLFLLLQQAVVFAVEGNSWTVVEGMYLDDKGEGEAHLRRGFGELVLQERIADRLAWLLMTGDLSAAATTASSASSFARPFSLVDYMALQWP